MKKMIYVGWMVMVSMMVFGFGISAAEENGVSDNMVASVAQERPAAEQTGATTEGILLALAGGCSAPVNDLCALIQGTCCAASSPSNPSSACGGAFEPGGTCFECGYECNQ